MNKKTIPIIIGSILVVLVGTLLLNSLKNSSVKNTPVTIQETQIDDVIQLPSPANTEETMDVQQVKQFTVRGGNFSYTPKTLSVKKGDTVQITFINDEGFHDFVLDEFSVRTKQINANEQEIVTFVADKAGTFEFYCSVGKHREMGMKGTLVITDK